MAAAGGPERTNQLFLGTFIHCKTRRILEYLHDAAVFVGAEGKIVAVEACCDEKRAEKELYPRLRWVAGRVTVVRSGRNQFFFPGFIDTHVHACQYPNIGIFGSSTLLDWLETYTFPLEASLTSIPKARRVYTACVSRTLAHGTTTAAYYATRDVAATNLLADICAQLGQRAFVGRVAMDREGICPSFYRDEDAQTALGMTRATIQHIRGIGTEREDVSGREKEKEGKVNIVDKMENLELGRKEEKGKKETWGLVTPIITPRFAPTSTPELLAGLGKLAAETGLPIQTHISENRAEVALVAELFGDRGYAEVYDSHGLLTPRTILAHAVWLTEAEAALIAARGAKVSHCPCSNTCLTSGAARVRWLWDHGIAVGLGTDMSGGYSPSVLEGARQASLVSRHVAVSEGNDAARLSVEEVLFLATRGGAEVVGMNGKVAGFEVGMEWDAQLVGLGSGQAGDGVEEDNGDDINEGSVCIFGWESWSEKVAKWVFTGDDRNTKMVWVAGRLVHSRN